MTNSLRSILCVDDEPDVLHIAQLCLEMVGGFTVTVASNGKDAVAQADRHPPDLILLDVMMPVQDGPATIAQLRALPAIASIPIIFMTARIRETERQEYLAMGANGVIAKPFDPMTLSEEVHSLWQQFHAGT